MTTSIAMMSTTIVVPTLDDQNMRNLNGTATKRTFKKGNLQNSLFFLSIIWFFSQKFLLVSLLASFFCLSRYLSALVSFSLSRSNVS